MNGSASRRGFLSGLVSLPLIGGSVALIGAPKAVAAPRTEAGLLRYCAFLAYEHRAALAEHSIRMATRSIAEADAAGRDCRPEYLEEARTRAWTYAPMHWLPADPTIQAIIEGGEPSTRAALVLSAVGCDWREGGR